MKKILLICGLIATVWIIIILILLLNINSTETKKKNTIINENIANSNSKNISRNYIGILENQNESSMRSDETEIIQEDNEKKIYTNKELYNKLSNYIEKEEFNFKLEVIDSPFENWHTDYYYFYNNCIICVHKVEIGALTAPEIKNESIEVWDFETEIDISNMKKTISYEQGEDYRYLKGTATEKDKKEYLFYVKYNSKFEKELNKIRDNNCKNDIASLKIEIYNGEKNK